MKMKYAACAVGLMTLVIALPVHAQERATLVLLDGQRPSGELCQRETAAGRGRPLRPTSENGHYVR
jgi:hypothetical protein